MTGSLRRDRAGLPGLVALATVLAAAGFAYADAFYLLPFGDDWHHIGRALSGGYASIFGEARFFRLWERAAYAVDQDLLAGVAALNRPLSFLALALCAGLTYRVARRFVAGVPWAVLAASLYVFHPANVSTVMQTDTVSQALAVLFSLLAIRLLVFSTGSAMWSGGAAVLAALLSKETVLGTVCWIPFALYLRERLLDGRAPVEARGSLIRAAITVGVALTLYLALRIATGTPLVARASGRYVPQFDVFPILENVANLIGAALYFGDASTLFVFGFTTWPVACIGLTAGLIVIALLGLADWWRRAKGHPGEARSLIELAIWLSFGGAAMVPVAVMGQVSEVYVAGLTPFAALAYGVLAARGFESVSTHPSTRPIVRHGVAVALIFLIASFGGLSIDRTIGLYAQVSARTWSFVQALHPLGADCLGAGREVILEANLADTTSGGRQYGMSSANNERIARRVIDGYGDPQLAAWLDRTIRRRAGGIVRMPPSDTTCRMDALTEASCTVRCSAGARPESEFMQCSVRREKCVDSRGKRSVLPMLFPEDDP